MVFKNSHFCSFEFNFTIFQYQGQRREGGDRPRFRRDGDKKDVGPGEGFKPRFRAEA